MGENRTQATQRVDYPFPEELDDFYREMFYLTTERALHLAKNLKEDEAMLELCLGDLGKICGLLALLTGAEYQGDKQSREGASYKSLAYVAHLYGLTDDERRLWYQAGKNIPLSQGHLSYLINNVRDRNRLLEEAHLLIGQG